MDQVYPDGSTIVCIKLHTIEGALESGKNVVVYRRRADGLTEATVKQYIVDATGKAWLWPRSSHPEHQAPIPVPAPDGSDEEVWIEALVVGSYRPE